jgi:prevent-host-death family protein
MEVNIHEAKTHFSSLIRRVQEGEEIVIAKAGQPVARLVPAVPPPRRVPGSARGMGIVIRDDFDDPLPPEIQRYFE